MLREFPLRNRRMILLSFLFLFIAIGCLWLHWEGPTAHAAGTIIYVKEGGSGLKNGSSWANAYDDLQKAIDLAPNNSQIWIAKGTYYPTRAGEPGNSSSRSFFLKNGVKIYGGFAGTEGPDYDRSLRDFEANETILDGNGEVYQVVSFSGIDNTTILDGVTITGGHNNSRMNGGGLILHNSTSTISNVVIRIPHGLTAITINEKWGLAPLPIF